MDGEEEEFEDVPLVSGKIEIAFRTKQEILNTYMDSEWTDGTIE